MLSIFYFDSLNAEPKLRDFVLRQNPVLYSYKNTVLELSLTSDHTVVIQSIYHRLTTARGLFDHCLTTVCLAEVFQKSRRISGYFDITLKRGISDIIRNLSK